MGKNRRAGAVRKVVRQVRVSEGTEGPVRSRSKATAPFKNVNNVIRKKRCKERFFTSMKD